jgi:hypothetical protein
VLFSILLCHIPAAASGRPYAHPKAAAGKTVFKNLPRTPEELLQRAVSCLNKGDTTGFYQLGVTREEYLVLYPYMDRADTTSNDDRDFRLGYFMMDNRKMIIRTFENYGKSNMAFSRLAFFAPPADKRRFRYHGSFHAWVKKDSAEVELLIAKSLISVDGGWKFWSFSAD